RTTPGLHGNYPTNARGLVRAKANRFPAIRHFEVAQVSSAWRRGTVRDHLADRLKYRGGNRAAAVDHLIAEPGRVAGDMGRGTHDHWSVERRRPVRCVDLTCVSQISPLSGRGPAFPRCGRTRLA